MTQRALTAHDLLRVRMADDPQISPDGADIAWVHTWVDAENDAYRSVICVSNVGSGVVQRMTSGVALDTHPRWSPDGLWLAFLRTEPPGVTTPNAPQLCIMSAHGGEPRTLTQHIYGVAEPTWSHSGEFLAFTALANPTAGLIAENGEEADDDLYIKFNRDVVVAKRRKWKMDGVGYLSDRRCMVFCAHNLFDGEPTVELVAGGDFDLYSPTWSPDGKQLAAVGNLDADADNVRRQYVYLLDMDHLPATPRKLVSLEDIRHTHVAWSPDGKRIALVGHNNAKLGHYGNQQLWTVDVTTGAARCVTGHLDWTLGHAAYTDVGRYGGDDGIRWLPDGRHILALISRKGAVHLHRIDVTTGDSAQITSGCLTVAAFTVDVNGATAATLLREPFGPGDIFLLHLDEEQATLDEHGLRRITAVNADLLTEIDLSPPVHFQFDNEGMTIDAWVLPPIEREPGRRYPAILYTGGGPAGMRAPNFMFEYQLLAAAGYALIFCNARGCQGYGEAFCTAILGAWGIDDFADNMRCLDEASACFDFIDPTRLGMAGGSYGGYLVNWALGHTNRFRAAVSDRSVFNRHSAFGTSDIGHLREFEFDDGPPWETGNAYIAQTPLTYIAGVETPTLVIHSARDLRCTVDQGEQLYMALKHLGAPTELVRFPNESHGLSRGGRPWHRVFRLQCYLDWFSRWIKEE